MQILTEPLQFLSLSLFIHKIKYTWYNKLCLFFSIVLASAELIYTSILCCGFFTGWMKVLIKMVKVRGMTIYYLVYPAHFLKGVLTKISY